MKIERRISSAADRPVTVPEGCTNLAFLGQFVEVEGDCCFTVELSVRTAMEAVYKLLHLEKDMLEVYPCRYDIRYKKEQMKKFAGLKQNENLTREQLPPMDPAGADAMVDGLLEEINSIPPYYIMYPGRDKSVALQESVLHPQYPVCHEKYAG